jgi:hypothetical protein
LGLIWWIIATPSFDPNVLFILGAVYVPLGVGWFSILRKSAFVTEIRCDGIYLLRRPWRSTFDCIPFSRVKGILGIRKSSLLEPPTFLTELNRQLPFDLPPLFPHTSYYDIRIADGVAGGETVATAFFAAHFARELLLRPVPQTAVRPFLVVLGPPSDDLAPCLEQIPKPAHA